MYLGMYLPASLIYICTKLSRWSVSYNSRGCLFIISDNANDDTSDEQNYGRNQHSQAYFFSSSGLDL